MGGRLKQAILRQIKKLLRGKSLDGVMNYPFRSAVIDFLLHRITAYELAKILLVLQQNYPKPFRMSTLNILGSHDTVRIITALGDAPDRDALSVGEQAKYTLSKEQRTLAKKRLKQAVLLQFFQEGVPCIYYGDELAWRAWRTVLQAAIQQATRQRRDIQLL